MSNLSIQEALDYCLVNPDNLSTPQLLDRFPQYRSELSDMLGLAGEVTAISPPSISAQRREAMKTRLMLATEQRAAVVRPIHRAKPVPWFLRPRWVMTAAAAVFLLFIWWSAARSLPYSPLYNVKLASENVMLNLTTDPASKAIVSTNIANARLYDMRAMQQEDKLAQSTPALESYTNKIDTAHNILQELTAGEQRANVATEVYKTSLAGQTTLGRIEEQIPDIAPLPVEFAAKLQQSEDKVEEVMATATSILEAEIIDPENIPIEPYIAILLTPVVLPTVTSVAGEVTPTSTFASANTTPTNIETATINETAVAVVPGGGSSPTSTPGIEPAASATPSEPGQIPTATSIATSVILPTNTPLPEPTSTTEIQPTPTIVVTFAPAIPTPTSVLDTTNTPTPSGTPTPQAVPFSTTEPAQPTSTPIPAQVSPTLPPQVSPTSPVVEPDATPTPTSTAQATQEPPTSTPTDTPTPTNTPEPTSTPTPTDTPTLTPTETPAPSICDLNLTQVTASCEGSTCASWTARIRNEGSGTVEADWVAELWVKTGIGGFVYADRISDSVTVAAGEVATIGDGELFCNSFPPDMRQFQVRVHLVPDGSPCNLPIKTSPATAACQLN
jgi:hypothetical protein